MIKIGTFVLLNLCPLETLNYLAISKRSALRGALGFLPKK
ncbi:hypothetical protein CY0110_17592 [Crocosphaera chwakensis CCY0110]|uniref:Uncharacterized protein n=1 Tax=Crocosphaera chwakensis CCY0110 TaxID=391612 RepID=A3IIK0_9CHRO|nr:hypothetical protein CY0110_17592 [Crocosphaera chwakensis CCY0110]